MDIADIPTWLEATRATAKLQADRWQGVDPSRLLEACDLIEQLLPKATMQVGDGPLVPYEPGGTPVYVPPVPVLVEARAREIAEGMLRQTRGGMGHEQIEASAVEIMGRLRSEYEGSWRPWRAEPIDRIGAARAERPPGTADQSRIPLILLHVERTRYMFSAQQRDYVIPPGTGLLRIEAVLHAAHEDRALDRLIALMPHALIIPY